MLVARISHHDSDIQMMKMSLAAVVLQVPNLTAKPSWCYLYHHIVLACVCIFTYCQVGFRSCFSLMIDGFLDRIVGNRGEFEVFVVATEGAVCEKRELLLKTCAKEACMFKKGRSNGSSESLAEGRLVSEYRSWTNAEFVVFLVWTKRRQDDSKYRYESENSEQSLSHPWN